MSASIQAPIPWSHPHAWQAAQMSLFHHATRLSGVRETLLPLARVIEACLAELARQMEILAAHTCSYCPDPCCIKASVWYDFRDLLGLHLCGTSIPIGQPISSYGGLCRYLTPTGCTLPRAIRPWICTWYLCPVQKRWLQKQPGDAGRNLELALAQIKVRRAALEKQFLSVVG